MSSRWYIRWPGVFYAEGPLTLYEGKKKVNTTSPSRARKLIRAHFNLDRLPAGFECWPTDD